MSEGKAGGGGEEAGAQEDRGEQGLQRLARNPAGLAVLLQLFILPETWAWHVQLDRTRETSSSLMRWVEGGLLLFTVGGQQRLRTRGVGAVGGVPRLHHVVRASRGATIRTVVAISAAQPSNNGMKENHNYRPVKKTPCIMRIIVFLS